MKLSVLNEYGPPSKLAVSESDVSTAFHKFISVVAKYFETGKVIWDTSRIPVRFDGKTISITIRHGVNVGSSDKPKLTVEASWDDTIEVRLDVPRDYQVNWEQQKTAIVGVISVNFGHQIYGELEKAANNIVNKMSRTGNPVHATSGRVTDRP